MGHRLTQIYTRTGDGGTTSIGTGERIAKDDLRVHLMGEVDELNALVGLILAHPLKPGHRACLEEIQHLLFDLGGDLAIPGRNTLKLEYIEWLNRLSDFLFVFSRVLAKEDQDAEVLWMPKARTLPEPSESI